MNAETKKVFGQAMDWRNRAEAAEQALGELQGALDKSEDRWAVAVNQALDAEVALGELTAERDEAGAEINRLRGILEAIGSPEARDYLIRENEELRAGLVEAVALLRRWLDRYPESGTLAINTARFLVEHPVPRSNTVDVVVNRDDGSTDIYEVRRAPPPTPVPREEK